MKQKTKIIDPIPGPPPDFGAWLRAERRQRGLTQTELARVCRISRSYIAHIEQGGAFAREIVFRIANGLELPADEVLGRAGFAVSSGLPHELARFAELTDIHKQLVISQINTLFQAQQARG